MGFLDKTALLFLLLWGLSSGSAEPKKKILLLTGDVVSTIPNVGRLGIQLKELGYDVTLMTTATVKKIPENLKKTLNIDSFKSRYPPGVLWKEVIDAAHLAAFNTSFSTVKKSYETWEECSTISGLELYEDAEALDRIRKANYDFVIADVASIGHVILPYKLGIRFGLFQADFFWQRLLPYFPSTCPILIKPYSGRMNFWQRLDNAIAYVLFLWMLPPSAGMDLIEKYAPEKPVIGFTELMREADLAIVMESTYLSTAKPTMPDQIRGATLSIDEPKPLPEEMLKELNQIGKPIILITFGTWITLPDYVFMKIVDAMSQLNAHVIWGYRGNLPDNPPANIKFAKWIPQVDLMASGKIDLFISHGGLNSMQQTAYHGVPVLVLPFWLDQTQFGMMAVDQGYARLCNMADCTTKEIIAHVKEMLQNKEYASEAKKISGIFQDIKKSGVENPGFWVDHVIKYGRRHLRSPAYDLAWYEYLMVDIVCFALGILTLVCGLIGLVIYCVCRRVFKIKAQKSKRD